MTGDLSRRYIRGATTAAFAVLLSIAAIPAFPQNTVTVSDVADYALQHSREISAAEASVTEARDALSEVLSLDKTSLTMSGGYKYTSPTDTSPPGFQPQSLNVEGSVNVPIIPELSVSASLGDTFLEGKEQTTTAGIGLKFDPFGAASTGWQDWETLRKAEITLQSLKVTVPMNAEAAALDLAKGQLDVDPAERGMNLAGRQYEVDQQRYDLDEITYSDLEDSRTSAATSRQTYYNSLKSLLSLKKNFFQIVGPNIGDIDVSGVSVDDVQRLIAERENALETAKEGAAITVNLLNLTVELEALKRQLKATPLLEPTLSVSGNMNLFNLSAGASVSLTISPDQYKKKERADIEASIADKEADLALERANVGLEMNMAEQGISVAREVFDKSMKDYENSQIQYREAQLLYQQGERTDLELEQTGLAQFSSSIQLFSAAVDLYKNLGDLLQLYLFD